MSLGMIQDISHFLRGHVRIKADRLASGAQNGEVGPEQFGLIFTGDGDCFSSGKAQFHQPQGKVPHDFINTIPTGALPDPPIFSPHIGLFAVKGGVKPQVFRQGIGFNPG
jgi:hypothetical protein